MPTTNETLGIEDQEQHASSYSAFAGAKRIASGALAEVARAVKEVIESGRADAILIFDNATSDTVELDFRGDLEEVLRKATISRMAPPTVESPAPETPRGPGRPKLGVIAKEVTLLPRHWDWLGLQPGGASVALRKLVEEARRANADRDRIRRAQEAAYRFMSAMAGNYPGFEEASRALFAGDQARFDALVEPWPVDVRDHAKALASVALPGNDQ